MPVAARYRSLPLVLCALVVTACGSTVQGTTATGPGNGSAPGVADGLGGTSPAGTSGTVPGTLGGTAGSGSTGSFGTGTSGGTSGSAAGGAGVGSTGGTTGGSTAGTTGPQGSGMSGPGVTAKEVYFGFVNDVGGDSVNQSVGAGAITGGDVEANTRAIVDDINKHGGVGGRKLVPVYARFDSTSSQTLDQQFSAICQQFTRDNPRVFAVEGSSIDPASYRNCIHKAGVTMLSTTLPTVDAEELQRYPGFIEQGYPNLDRLAAYHVTPLVEQKYFTPWNTVTNQPAATGKAKVGILTYNDRMFSGAVKRHLVPALQRLGFEPVVAEIAPLTGQRDIGAQAAAVKSAQLAFASQGVTHVIPFEANAGLSLFFLPNADSQRYYPRYGISSASGFQALLDTGLVKGEQVHGTLGFGWIPSLDLPGRFNPDDGPYSNANRRYCLKVMKEHDITFSSPNAQAVALNNCSNLYLFKAALDRTPSLITRASVVGVVEALGASYQRAGSIGQEFVAGRHDPSNKAYHWRYFTECGCFHYEGSINTIP